jgi:hypothetical protein
LGNFAARSAPSSSRRFFVSRPFLLLAGLREKSSRPGKIGLDIARQSANGMPLIGKPRLAAARRPKMLILQVILLQTVMFPYQP